MQKHRYQQTVEQIQSLIKNGELQPGDKLPSERKLSETFHVSRNCVREAIRSLAEQGVLESRLGDGTYLCFNDQEKLTSELAQAIEKQKERLEEIFELRMVLEPQVAALATERISASQLNKLKAIVFDQHRAALEQKDDSGLDGAFHQILAEAAGNKVLLEVLETIQSMLRDTRSPFLRDCERSAESVEGHLAIIAALESGESMAAFSAMTTHINTMRKKALHDSKKG